MRVRLGRVLVRLYPAGWRARFGAEMAALLEDDPPGPAGLLSLGRGAATEHLHPARWRGALAPVDRVRLSLGAAFACWIGLSVAGVCFQKETEEQPFAAPGAPALLTAARAIVLAGAALGAGAIAAGGVPLLWRAALQAARRREPALVASLALPAAGLAQFILVTAAAVALGPGDLGGASVQLRLAVLVPWWVSGAAFALSCALAPRIALRHAEVPARTLRRASLAMPALVAAMALVTGGMALYELALARSWPLLFAHDGGPLWPETGAVLAVAVAAAALFTAFAALACVRGLGAARTLRAGR